MIRNVRVAIEINDTTSWAAVIVLLAGWITTALLVAFVSWSTAAADPSWAGQDFWIDSEWTQTFASYVSLCFAVRLRFPNLTCRFAFIRRLQILQIQIREVPVGGQT